VGALRKLLLISKFLSIETFANAKRSLWATLEIDFRCNSIINLCPTSDHLKHLPQTVWRRLSSAIVIIEIPGHIHMVYGHSSCQSCGWILVLHFRFRAKCIEREPKALIEL